MKDHRARPSDSDRAVGFFAGAAGDEPTEVVSAADAHAIAALQFADVLSHVAGFAATPLGAAHLRARVPRSVPRGDGAGCDAVREEHRRVGALRALIGGEAEWPSPPIPDVGAALGRLEVAGSAWTGVELRDAITLLAGSRALLAALRAAKQAGIDTMPLDAIASNLVSDAKLEGALDRVVDEAGVVRDGASPELRKIRKQLRGAEADLIRLLEKLMGGLESHHRVDDASVTMRNGRWVIPVRREGRGSLGGIVHDTSASGATVFVEPPAAVEFGNRIRELQVSETREVERVLREATDELRPHAAKIGGAWHALVELDSLHARARFAERYRCAAPHLVAAGQGFAIVDGRHPLLLAKDAESVVAFGLALDAGEHTLLVSGPNTGGKTVLLKAVALLSLMAQAGVPPTVGAGTTLALFDRVFADIGDEQSIEASLSTFSGHVKNLIEIVEQATPDSLVLVDELGSGTDPNEGAALGAAILDALTRRGTTAIATTHLGALKELAHREGGGIVNASLQFDEVLLAPTYRLLKGIPGRSYGLSIARRLRMPQDILADAEARVPKSDRDAAALIEDLERRQRELETREREADEREASHAERRDRFAEREQMLRARERDLERSARDAEKRYVLDARKEIEAAIAELRSTAGASAVDDAAARARRTAENLLQSQREAARALEADDGADSIASAGAVGELRPGDRVILPSFGGATAQVIEARGGELVVLVGSVRTTVPAAGVRRAGGRKPAAEPVAILGAAPEVHAKPEIDVRGMRISEIDTAVQQALDDAVRADLPMLRIIHGKGTGALRERVGELLKADPRVREFRLGAWNEGGAGVTVVGLS